jgi:outer membrane protein
MKRSLALVITLASGLVLTAAAQTPATPASVGPAKIAVINFQAAVSQTNEFQRNYADLQKKFDPKRQQLKTLSDEITNLQKQLQAEAAKLSGSESASRSKAIDDKQKQAQRLTQDAQTDFQADMQETFNAMATKVGEVMVSYAQKQGYSLVMDAGQQQTPVVIYAEPSMDITKAVIDAYNVKSGVPAPAAPPAGASTGPAATGTKPAATKPATVAPKAAAKPAAKPAATH